MKYLGVIPARYNSSRFQGKPVANICGKPMIYWVYKQVEKVKKLDEIVVATDDIRILEVCNKYSLKAIMTSSNHLTGTDRLGEVANKIIADYYINIQGDEPIIEPSVISQIVEACEEFTQFDAINTMTEITNKEELEMDSVVKVAITDQSEGIFLSRAQIPYSKSGKQITYYKHLGLYGLKRDSLLYFSNKERGRIEQIEDIEMLRFIENGKKIKFIEVVSDSIAVDREEDIERVEEVMRRKVERN